MSLQFQIKDEIRAARIEATKTSQLRELARTEIPFSVGAKQVSFASPAFDLRDKKGEAFHVSLKPNSINSLTEASFVKFEQVLTVAK